MNRELKGMKEMMAYKQGLKDCWAIAQMLVLDEGYSGKELLKIFGDDYSDLEHLFKNYTIEQVIKKVSEFTETRFRIGDKVRLKNSPKDKNKYIVISEESHGLVNVINKDFELFTFPTTNLIKTGYNFDIAKMIRNLDED